MKFDMGAAWDEAVAMMAANREVLAIVAGIFFFLPSLLLAIFGPDLNAMMAGDLSSAEQVEQMGEQVMAAYSDSWWIFAIATLAQMIGYISLLALLRDKGRPTVGEAIAMGAKGLLPSIAAYLIVTIGLSVLFVIFVALAAVSGVAALAAVAVLLACVVMVYAMIKFSLAAPVIAIEKVTNPITVLKRSWHLTKGNSVRILLFFMLIFVVYMVVSIVAGLILAGLVSAVGSEAGKLIQGVVGGLLGMVATVVVVAVLAATHRQLSGGSASASDTFA
ncbi:hypothetical protein D2V17_19190 [Aurantiacibacter xanthus]|uniref:Glycerophosphoryl diester phosphodiesterase membrane domain-containing protein n=1 Tax=Aurantiacibacter xanthus TaxID=1784712 RepID=A0A3A1NZ79_9SPHN|nr:hypothetical protein [Aurantiacibacter xanthus]RIV80447.1 hypothetical protein D2V17_19190 [Aurantiacibacter xanthus]